MDELNVDWGTMLRLRDTLQRAAVELTSVYRSESINEVLECISIIDDILDEDKEYDEDEYEDSEYTDSELRF